MVRVATRIGSTSARSPLTRSTARTILLTSTGSLSPLRLRTCIEVLPTARLDAAVTVTSLSSRDRSRRSGVVRRRRRYDCGSGRAGDLRTSYEPSPVPRGLRTPRPTGEVRWQVFGLVGTSNDLDPY